MMTLNIYSKMAFELHKLSIDKKDKMTKYIRIKSGEANFQLLSERFDDVEKAANPNAQGEYVECKVDSVKLDFTKVKKEKDGKAKTKFQKYARPSEEKA